MREIIYGAIGSALFWLVLQLLTYAAPHVARAFGLAAERVTRNRKIREYVFRRFTGMSGLVNYTEGYLFTFSRVLEQVLSGFIFVCIALLFGGLQPVVWAICLIGAIYFFLRGLVWLLPPKAWKRDAPRDNWLRIAELERELQGTIAEDTTERIQSFGSTAIHAAGSATAAPIYAAASPASAEARPAPEHGSEPASSSYGTAADPPKAASDGSRKRTRRKP